MVIWHHQVNGHEFEQTLGDSEAQGSLPCCSPWGHKELDMTDQLSTTHLTQYRYFKSYQYKSFIEVFLITFLRLYLLFSSVQLLSCV